MLLVFPLFTLGFFYFYFLVCAGDVRVLTAWTWFESMTPAEGQLTDFLGRMCERHLGAFWPEQLRIPESWRAYYGLGWLLLCVEGLFAVALPEEIFHRGYLMSALEGRWPAKRTLFGVPFGLAAVLSSLIFALGHLVGMAQSARLATFFPALVFAWLWRRSGSLWAPALFHTASNLLMDVLLASTFPSS